MAWLFLEPDTRLDHCPRILLSCFRARNSAFREHGMHLNADRLLCGDRHKPLSDEYLECYVKEYIAAGYHPVATCSMGPQNGNSVVDHRLRVHGIGRLRVVDATLLSIHPENAVVLIQTARTVKLL